MPKPLRVLTWNAVSTKLQDTEDKFSIDYQLKLNRAIVEKLGGEIVDELIVRGFSRDYWTLADVVAATDDTEVDAFRELWRYIQAHAFDVFVCFEADRFGRTTSLVHEIIGRITRDLGADIITTFDNTTIDERNAVMIGSIKAISARQGVEKLVEWRRQGMDKRARDGRFNGSDPPLFLVRIRDAKGKETGLVVNEALRPLWTDLATCILEGVPWQSMEQVLFERFGHGRDGQPYPNKTMREQVMKPAFFGHATVTRRRKRDPAHRWYGPWCWDETVPPPEGMILYYHVRPPVYDGDYADLNERIKAELWRRYRLEGKSSPVATSRFHGLMVCADCGYTLSVCRPAKHRALYMRCGSRWGHVRAAIVCPAPNYIRFGDIETYLSEHLQRRLDGLPTEIFDPISDTVFVRQRLNEERARLQKTEERLRALIRELADAPDVAKVFMRQQMNDLSGAIERARSVVHAHENDLNARQNARHSQEWGFGLLREHGIDWLWQQPDTLIHQVLSSILVDNQLVVRAGKIVGALPSRNKALVTLRKRDR